MSIENEFKAIFDKTMKDGLDNIKAGIKRSIQYTAERQLDAMFRDKSIYQKKPGMGFEIVQKAVDDLLISDEIQSFIETQVKAQFLGRLDQAIQKAADKAARKVAFTNSERFVAEASNSRAEQPPESSTEVDTSPWKKGYTHVGSSDFHKTFGELPNPDEASKAEVQKGFQNICHRIHQQIAMQLQVMNKSHSGRRDSEEEALRNELRRNAYILMHVLDDRKAWHLIEDLIQRKTPGKRARSHMAKRYVDLLHYILRDDETGNVLLPSPAIGEISNQLAYAHRHDVPFPFLSGFLSEVHFEKAAQKERANEWESWHPSSRASAKRKPATLPKDSGKRASPSSKPSRPLRTPSKRDK